MRQHEGGAELLSPAARLSQGVQELQTPGNTEFRVKQ